jgi:hypothetical protein
MYKNGIDLRICVNGRSVKEYAQNGMQFIESRNGSSYTIKIKNDNAYRVMAIVSVDGLDVITGKAAEDSNKGYIVDAYSSTEIKGYRISDTDSAAFVFVSKDKSYVANATSDARNSGVIGIRVFEEKPEKVKVIEKHIHHHDYYPVYPWNPWPSYPPPYTPIWCTATCTGTYRSSDGTFTTNAVNNVVGVNATLTSGVNNSNNRNLGATNLSAVSPSLSDLSANVLNGTLKACSTFDNPIKLDAFDTGTSWGDKQVDRVKKEAFRKGKSVAELVIYYASAEALTNMGIDLSDTPKISEGMPKAFGSSQYCQPPKGWNG